MTEQDDAVRRRANRVAIGAWLLLAGALLLVDDLIGVPLGRLGDLGRLWPLLLVGLGLTRWIMVGERHGGRSGFWLLAIGLWFSAHTLLGYGVRQTWPLLLVAVGAGLVWSAFGPRRGTPVATEGNHV